MLTTIYLVAVVLYVSTIAVVVVFLATKIGEK